MSNEILNAAEHNTRLSGVSFSRRNRLFRLAWTAAWLVLASWTPRGLHSWRRLLLRTFGAKIAPTAGVYGSARIWNPANLELGERAFIGPRVIVYSMAKIVVGPDVTVSQGAHLCAGSHDIEDPHFQLIARPITIGAQAWIAAEAFVGPGVEVGEGAVLGARGCAFGDLAPWTVYVGNPAKALKPRRVRSSGAPEPPAAA
jgi:putative colanic acid biosynthesis acetyltransferase WcaF